MSAIKKQKETLASPVTFKCFRKLLANGTSGHGLAVRYFSASAYITKTSAAHRFSLVGSSPNEGQILRRIAISAEGEAIWYRKKCGGTHEQERAPSPHRLFRSRFTRFSLLIPLNREGDDPLGVLVPRGRQAEHGFLCKFPRP